MPITAGEAQEERWTKETLSAREEQPDPLLAPYVLLRITGLSFETLDHVQFPETTALLEEILSIEAWLEERRTSLLDQLGALLQQLPGSALQHACMDLRRAIAGTRGQRAATFLSTLAPALPPELAAELGLWCQHALRRTTLFASGEPTLQRELTRCRQHLRQMFQNEDFQRGLLLSSPTLYTELQHYLATSASETNNRIRRTEEGLLSYLVRMVTKPSPYSTFTSTTPGSWDHNERHMVSLEMSDWSQQGVARLHTGLLQTLLQLVARHPDIAPHLRPRLNSSMRWLPAEPDAPAIPGLPEDLNQVGRLEFFTSQQKHFPHIHYDERIMRLRLNTPFRLIISTILSTGETLSSQELLARVLQLSRKEAAQPGCDEQDIAAALEYLVAKGAIIRDLELPENEDDTLAWVSARLATLPGEYAASIHKKFQMLHDWLKQYVHLAATQRFALLAAIRTHVLDLSKEIAPEPEVAQWLETILTRHSPPVLLEDSIRLAHSLTLGTRAWASLFPGLRALSKMASLLSADCIWQRVSTALGGHIATLYAGKKLDVIDYHHLLNQQIARPDHSFAHLYWTAIFPQLLQIRDLRRALAETVLTHLREVSGHVLTLSLAEIDAFVRTLPPWLDYGSSLTHFCQLFSEQQAPGLVINSTWSGPTSAFSRFGYLLQRCEAVRGGDASVIPELRAYLLELGTRQNVLYTSIAETGNFNVNTHLAVAPYEILFPTSTSLLPRQRQLTLRDLHVAPVSGTAPSGICFYARDLEVPLCPVHMGYSIIMRMPPLYQTLVTPGSCHPFFDLISLIEAQLTPEQKTDIRHYPRVTIDRIVLNREMWKIPHARLPKRDANESAFDYFVKVNRWRLAQKLPRHVFRRALSRSEFHIQWQHHYLDFLLRRQPSGSAEELAMLPNRPGLFPENLQSLFEHDLRKPFYVDFHNYFLVKMLGDALENLPAEQGLTFEEMLPSREQAVICQQEKQYASELVIELG